MKTVKIRYGQNEYNDNPTYANYLIANFIISSTPCKIKGLTDYYKGIDAKSHYNATHGKPVEDLFELLISKDVLIAVLGYDDFKKKYKI